MGWGVREYEAQGRVERVLAGCRTVVSGCSCQEEITWSRSGVLLSKQAAVN